MSNATPPNLSVVIPVYRSAATLGELTRRLTEVLDELRLNYEIVMVDDGSPDDSWRVLESLARQYSDHLSAIQLMRNYGQHNALMAGFRRSRGQIVVTMDDDLQHPPEEIAKILDELKTKGLDLVYGVYQVKRHGGWRNFGSTLVTTFYKLVFRSRTTITAFRAIRRELLETIFSYDLNFTFIDGLLAWNTQRIGQVAVRHDMRSSGRSGYSFSKLLLLALNLFTNFSLLPLQVISGLGFLTAIGGLSAAVYYLVQYLLMNITVPGYASIIIAILVLGGIQLMSLGIMGEYLGRLHLNVNRKPQYFERQVLTHLPSPPPTPEIGKRPASPVQADRSLAEDNSSMETGSVARCRAGDG